MLTHIISQLEYAFLNHIAAFLSNTQQKSFY